MPVFQSLPVRRDGGERQFHTGDTQTAERDIALWPTAKHPREPGVRELKKLFFP